MGWSQIQADKLHLKWQVNLKKKIGPLKVKRWCKKKKKAKEQHIYYIFETINIIQVEKSDT